MKENNSNSEQKKIQFNKLLSEARNISSSNNDKRLTLVNSALLIAEDINYLRGVGECKVFLGEIYLDISRYEDSLYVLLEAQRIFTNDDQEKLCRAYNNIGVNYYYLANYETALEYYEKGLKLSEKIDDEKGYVNFLINIGLIYYESENHEKAIDFFSQALNKSKEDKTTGICLMNIGSSYMKMGDNQTALENLEKGLQLQQKANYNIGIISNLIDMGKIHRKLSKRDIAREYYEESLVFLTENLEGNHYYESEIYLNLAYLHQDNQEYNQAKTFYKKAFNLAQMVEAKKLIYYIHEGLAKLYEEQGNFKDSLEHLKLLQEINSKINNEETRRKLKSLRIEHEVREVLKQSERAEQSYNMLKTINKLGQRLISCFDLEEIVMTIYQEVNQLMDATSMGIGLYDKNKKIVNYQLLIEDGKRLIGRSFPIDETNSITSWCIRNDQILHISNLSIEYKKYINSPAFIQGQAPLSLICIPLKFKDKIIGVVTVQSPKENTYDSNDLETLQILSSYLAIAMDNNQRFQIEKQKRQVSESLQDFSSLLTSSLDLETVLNRFLANLNKFIDYQLGLVLLMKVNTLQAVAIKGDYSFLNITEFQLRVDQEPIFQEILNKSTPVIVDKIRGEQFFSNLDRIKNWFAIPLKYQEKIDGILLLGNIEQDYFRNKDLDFVTALSGQAAIAINNAKLFEEVNNLASRDSLTTLYNRRIFLEIAKKEMEQAKRYRYPLSLIIFDVDNFKKFNDQYGHLFGDKMLRKLAEVAERNIRKADVLGRYGGEEFIVLAPLTNIEGGQIIADKLRNLIANTSIDTEEYGKISVTCSFGVAAGADNLNTLLKMADKALYQAKNQGKNRVTIWDGEAE